MKHDLKLLMAAVIALGLPAATQADTLTSAQITQIVKEVQTIDPGKGARAAVMKETLQGEQSVRTGSESRTELLFNDKTITRLGANAHFSFSDGTRNMSLQSGVMLLQVPKGAGGAKIETAAVTAAVTGTTIMIEAGKDYTKLIVLEGECCIWPKNDKKDNKFFKFKKKTCAVAGQEIIMRNGAKDVPDPVYVNLRILENTSLLITGDWNSPLNDGPINTAADDQKPKDFIPTNLAIIGAGTDVVVITDQNPQNPPTNPGGNPPGTPPNIPGKYGALGTIGGNPYVAGGSTIINTDPTIKTNGVTSYGRIYRGALFDGSATSYFLGANSGVSETEFDNTFSDSSGHAFPNYGVTAFKFTALSLQGMPLIEMAGNGSNDLALITVGNLSFDPLSDTTFDFSQIYDMALISQFGNININGHTSLTGLQDSLKIFAAAPTSNVNIDGFVQAPYVSITSGGVFSGTGGISAQTLDITAGSIVTLNEQQTEGAPIDTVNGVSIDMNSLYRLSLTGNEVDVQNGFTGEPYEGPDSEQLPSVDLYLTAKAGNNLPGDVNLDNFITVDYLSVNADHNVTFGANSDIELPYYGGIDISAGNDVTLDGYFNGSYITVSAGNNVSLISTNEGGSLNFGNIDIYSGGTVDINTTIFADGNMNVDSSAQVTVEPSANIYANHTTLNTSGTVQVNGFIGGNDFPANSFTSNSTGAADQEAGAQDFFGTGSIDAQVITINSSGDLTLDKEAVNGVSINPNFNLQELDLSGATIELTTTFQPDNEGPVTLKLNATGDIGIGANVNVGEFDATTQTHITFTGNPLVSASTVALTTPNVNAELDQDVEIGSTFYFTEFTTGTASSQISTGRFSVAGQGFASISLSANAITIGTDMQAGGMYLSFTSATDINAGSSATISNAASVALQVGVDAVLAGDGNTSISYNGGQLNFDSYDISTVLQSFSVNANSVTVNSGFPFDLSGASLSFTATGTGGITTNSSITASSMTFTAQQGDININNSLTTVNGGAIDLEAQNGGINVFGSITSDGDLTMHADGGDLTVGFPLSVGGSLNASASGKLTIEVTDPSVNGSVTLSAGTELRIEDNITLGGSLNLSAGTFMHTSNNAEIDGATDVTLSLGTTAEIRETGDAETAYVYFGVPAANEAEGFSPFAIDIFNASFIDASATQLTLTSDFEKFDSGLYLTATAGDLTLNGEVFVANFSGSASGIITGTGSIVSPSVSLTQGGTATLAQSGSSALTFNGLSVALGGTYGATSLSFSAGTLNLTSAISIPSTDITLSGGINAQGNSITANNVTLSGLHTTTDGSGNATSLSINAYSLVIYGFNLDGVALGNGGVFTGSASVSGTDPGITVNGELSASGGSLGGNGGTVNLNSQGTISINMYFGEGFADGHIYANGGNANPASASPGGNGGTVNLTAQNDIYVEDRIMASTGINGNGTFTGGAGGTVNLTSQNGTVNVDSTVEVSSSDLVNHRVSARGGNINVTSHKTSGVAINISDSGQLNALLNQAAPGPGGKITFVADGGGNINVNGKIRADHGTIDIQNKGTSSGDVTFNNAQLSADVVKVATLSPNGTLTIGGGVINGDTAIQLYAAGANGTVQFVANTSLTGASVKSIAGNTVTINNGVAVNVTGGAATVYTNNANYQGSGGNNSTTGVFTGNANTTTKPFSSRPAF